MPCYYPNLAYLSSAKTEAGKRKLVFRVSNADRAFIDRPLFIPCGQCIGCRLERSRQWAVRCLHESKLHAANSFITLTYDGQHVPQDGSLSIRHFQLFMKKLRKQLSKQNIFIRHFACGEYGEKLGRPHYHACIFGFDFPDKKLIELNGRGDKVYQSDFLTSVWGQGLCRVGDLTFESAAYVARYVCKKITGDAAAAHYGDRVPEFTLHSKKPGIGQGFYRKFKSDIYPHDEVIVRGRQMRPPVYYDRQLEKDDPQAYTVLRQSRSDPRSIIMDGDKAPERRHARERVQQARMKRLPRKVD